jgi:peptidyl-prolyl cis-trans isomerase C
MAALGPLAACTKEHGHAVAGSGPAVVTYGDHVITADQLRHELSEQSPFIRSRYQSLDKKKELVDGIVRLDLLADEATKDGFDQDPEVQREFKKAMVQRWLRKKFNDKEGMANLTDADLHAYYDAHKDDYQRPAKLRLQVIFYKTEGEDGAKVRAEATADQKALTPKVQKQDVAAFADRARSRSDDAVSKIRGGDIDFHTHDDLAKLYGEAVAAAADALKGPNEISPVIEGTNGFYLLRLEASQPAFNRGFDQVKETLRSRLWNERHNQAFEDYVKKLREQANVKIDDAELAKVDANRPDLTVSASPSQPPPMAPPPTTRPSPAMARTPPTAPPPAASAP